MVCRRRRLSILCAIRRWPSFDSRQKAVLQSNNKTRQEKPKLERNRAKKLLNIRMTNQENITSFKQELAKQTWENVYQAANVHEAYHVFMTKIVKLYNATCPLKKVTVRARNKYKPWITTGLKKMPVVLKFLRTRNYETETRYKTYKNKLTSILRHCERDYYRNLLEVKSSNIKETWKVLNGIIKNTRLTQSIQIHLFMNINRSTSTAQWIYQMALIRSSYTLGQICKKKYTKY